MTRPTNSAIIFERCTSAWAGASIPDVHRLVDRLLISTLVLTACGDGGSSTSSTDGESSTDGGPSSTDDSSADTSSSGTDTMTTSETGETDTGECGSQSPALLCDTMLAFYEDARALNESQESGCQLLGILGRGVGPDGILLDGVFMTEPLWLVTYVCPGRRIEYYYTAVNAEYPLVAVYDEDVDPSDFKQIESALVDSPAMMEVYAGTNCPDILTIDEPRFIVQPSGIALSTAVYEIGETLGDRAMITVDAVGEVVEIFPCP
jgi:hypothetical protein